MGYAIRTTYENSIGVSAFSSKLDVRWRATIHHDRTELAGYNLFEAEAIAINAIWTAGQPRQRPHLPMGQPRTAQTRARRRKRILMFTCFGSANLGLPRNLMDSIYFQITPDFFGFTPNAIDFGFVDLGWDFFLDGGSATTRTLAGRNRVRQLRQNAGVYGAAMWP